MISVHLTGNFGDHVVRYALCRTVAEKKGVAWAVNPVPSYDYYRGQPQMGFFNLDYGLPNHALYEQLPDGIEHEWVEKFSRYPGYNFYDFQPDIFEVEDNTNLKIFCGQDARYYDRYKLMKWFSVVPQVKKECEDILSACHINLDDVNLTVINCRGGEYRGISDLFLQPIYYKRAMLYMRSINPQMRFIVITDDEKYYRSVFDIPVFHFSIYGDYYVINHARNLIISNSGFALFPVWLNKNSPNVIAPMHWARHNLGIWASSAIWTFGKEDDWLFLDREGQIKRYSELGV